MAEEEDKLSKFNQEEPSSKTSMILLSIIIILAIAIILFLIFQTKSEVFSVYREINGTEITLIPEYDGESFAQNETIMIIEQIEDKNSVLSWDTEPIVFENGFIIWVFALNPPQMHKNYNITQSIPLSISYSLKQANQTNNVKGIWALKEADKIGDIEEL